ncbi:hypothetical protein [Sinomonas sp. G460-2]|uniref:hypothetical protein n=1 Tax=Sinomonas sp. G460-2 TaxID=3393464 RepID=UPI0039EE4B36
MSPAQCIILLAAGFEGAFAPSFGFLLVVFGARATDPGFHALAWVLAGIGAAVLLMALADQRILSVAA